jgi:hypothetical protein
MDAAIMDFNRLRLGMTRQLPPQNDGDPVSGSDAVGYALSDLLGNQEVMSSISQWISKNAEIIPTRTKMTRLSVWLGFVFGLAIFAGIAGLGYLKILNEQSMSGLLGTLIGFWFGQRTRP